MAEKKQTDIQEVARLAGCSTDRVRKLIKAGKIPAKPKGRQLEIAIPIEDAARIVREGQRKYQKKSRIVWMELNPNKLPVDWFGMPESCMTPHLISDGKAIIQFPRQLPASGGSTKSYTDLMNEGFKWWAYITPEMLPAERGV